MQGYGLDRTWFNLDEDGHLFFYVFLVFFLYFLMVVLFFVQRSEL